jgi:hypothetical protein
VSIAIHEILKENFLTIVERDDKREGAKEKKNKKKSC